MFDQASFIVPIFSHTIEKASNGSVIQEQKERKTEDEINDVICPCTLTQVYWGSGCIAPRIDFGIR
jgi:hypothetical protein